MKLPPPSPTTPYLGTHTRPSPPTFPPTSPLPCHPSHLLHARYVRGQIQVHEEDFELEKGSFLGRIKALIGLQDKVGEGRDQRLFFMTCTADTVAMGRARRNTPWTPSSPVHCRHCGDGPCPFRHAPPPPPPPHW